MMNFNVSNQARRLILVVGVTLIAVVSKGIMTVNTLFKNAVWVACLVLWMAGLESVSASPHGGGPTTITGVVYKQGLVFDEVNGSNQPRYVEFDADTGDVEVWIDDPDIDASDRTLWIGNGTDYRSAAAAYNNFVNLMSSDDFAKLTVVTKKQFSSPSFNADYPAEFLEFKGTPYTESRSLLVYKPEALNETVQLDDQNGLIVFESRYDLEELQDGEESTTKSLILDDEGKILHRSVYNIGFRVAFVTPDGEVAEERSASYKPGDELVAPITYGTVSTGLNPVANFPIGEDGRYQALNIMPPCPGMTMDFLVPVTAAIPYRTYNPQREGSFNQYFFSSYSNYFCAGAPFHPPGFTLGGVSAYIDSLATYALLNDQPPQAHFKIDVTLLSGQFKLSNGRYEPGYNEESTCDVEFADDYADEDCFGEIPVGDATTYGFETEHSKLYKLPEAPDFNFDGEDDYVALLDENADEQSSSSYGVWFNLGDEQPASGLPLDEDGELIEPDLVRYTKQDQNFDHLGLLTQISEEDLANTDIYIFRESTGELVVEKSPFSKGRGTGTNGVSAEINGGYFELTVPGRDGYQSAQYFGRAKGRYEEWQADMDLEKAFQGDVDSLRSGEPIRVVAINRATGYVGSVRTNLTQSDGLNFNDSMLGIRIPKLILYPPNLKVEVTRKYEVEYGLTQGEDRKYGVGFEGAALHGDQYLSIHTEWLDYDGTQLPKELPGLTGRLSSIVSENTLSDSKVNHFDIKTGKHIEVLNLSKGTAGVGASHQYVHVVGENTNDEINFGTTGSGELQYRPAKPTPVRVAVYDEDASRELKVAQLELEDEELKQDSSVYKWVYRPEMMYSVYELEVEGILRKSFDDDFIDITDSETPIITADDQALEIKSSLRESEFDLLELFGSESAIVVSMEEYQQKVAPESSWIFNVFGHIGDIEAEDFLTVNLINNQDSGNVLWEWAFEYLFLETQFAALDTEELQPIFVSADEPVIPLQGELVGYEKRSDRLKDLVRVNWRYSGSGSFDERSQYLQENGVVFNQFTVSNIAGSKAQLTLEMAADRDLSTTIGEFITIPGAPADVKVFGAGRAYVENGGPYTITVTVRDKQNNVVADGTSVNITVTGAALVNDYDAGTVDGIVSAEIRGGMFDGNFTATIDVEGELTQTHNFSVKPYALTIEKLPEHVFIGQPGEMVVLAVDDSGNPPELGTPINLVANGLVVNQESVVSDSDGRATIEFQAGYLPQDVDVKASIGYTEGVSQVVALRNRLVAQGTVSPVSVQQRVLLGDKTADGTLNFDRFDGVTLGIPYAAELSVELNGGPLNTIDLSLGTPARPNVEPWLAYYMSDGGDTDATSVGLDAVSDNHAEVIQSHDDPESYFEPTRVNHYRQHPGDSLLFDGNSYLQTELSADSIDSESIGFRFDIYIEEQSQGEMRAFRVLCQPT